MIVPPAAPVRTEPAQDFAPVFTAPLAEPQPGWRQRLRGSMGGQEWEAVVGGNWLNKAGVLVLVIGIAFDDFLLPKGSRIN